MKYIERYYILIPITLATLCSFLFLGTKSLWFDEVVSVLIAHDFTTMLHTIVTQEGNMWLYYFLLHFWLRFGESEFAIRSLSVLCAVLTIPVLYLLGSKLFDKKTAVITTLLLPFNLFYVFYAQEVRGYSLALLFVTVSSYVFIQLIEKPSKKLAALYTITTVLGIYTHLYVGLVLLAHATYAFFLPKKCWTYILASYFFVAVSLVPLVLSPSFHSGQIDWITKPGFKSIIGTFLLLSGDFPITFVIYGFLYFVLCVFLVETYKQFSRQAIRKYVFVICWLIVPIVCALLFSLTVKPLYESTYFIICLPPFLLLASSALATLRPWMMRAMIVLIMFFSLIRLGGWYTQSANFSWILNNQEEGWKQVVPYITSQQQPHDGIMFYAYFAKEPFYFYYDKQKLANASLQTIEIASQPYNIGGGQRLSRINQSVFEHLPRQYPRIWFVLSHPIDLSGKQYETEKIKQLLARNYKLKKQLNFSKITVYLYGK